jgi:hypothetical protein
MEAIRKKRIKRTGKQVIVDLPEDFKAEEVDLILWASQEESETGQKDKSLDVWRADLKKYYSQFNVNLSNFKFNRDELYDR